MPLGRQVRTHSSPESAVSAVRDGDTVLVGGYGMAGMPSP
ncbi:CoA-transferase [Nocardioides carbamazepini]|nr:CoA-transferase [Nocardioides carbamazepini]